MKRLIALGVILVALSCNTEKTKTGDTDSTAVAVKESASGTIQLKDASVQQI